MLLLLSSGLRPGYAVVAEGISSAASQPLPEALRTLWPDRFASASAAKKAVRRRRVLVGDTQECNRNVGDVVAQGTRVRLLARVEPGPAAGEGRRGRCEAPLRVCFEDDHLAVVYKPAGLSIPGVRARIATGLAPTRCERDEPLWRPQHVHRLDAPTSGLLVCAKTGHALRTLSAAFAARHVHKTYRAIVHGDVRGERGTIQRPLSGQSALTEWTVHARCPSEVYGAVSLVSLVPVTGRTHQLRRHLALIGHPILGDPRYWPSDLPRESAPRELGAADEHDEARQELMLSAVRVELPHPATGETLVVHTEQPAAFDGWLGDGASLDAGARGPTDRR